MRSVAPLKRGRPAASRADRDPKLALAAVYARMIRRVWRAHGVALNGDATGKADEWAARMALGETDISREASGKCSDLASTIPAELGRASDRSYAATPLTELEPLRPTYAGNPSL